MKGDGKRRRGKRITNVNREVLMDESSMKHSDTDKDEAVMSCLSVTARRVRVEPLDLFSKRNMMDASRGKK